MKKQTTQKTEYIIEQNEIGIIKTCLDYCSHRLYNHKCGIEGMVNLDKLNKIRKTFDEKDNENIITEFYGPSIDDVVESEIKDFLKRFSNKKFKTK